jgi:hypothetical protein
VANIKELINEVIMRIQDEDVRRSLQCELTSMKKTSKSNYIEFLAQIEEQLENQGAQDVEPGSDSDQGDGE